MRKFEAMGTRISEENVLLQNDRQHNYGMTTVEDNPTQERLFDSAIRAREQIAASQSLDHVFSVASIDILPVGFNNKLFSTNSKD